MPVLRFSAPAIGAPQTVALERRDCKIKPTFIMADNTGVRGTHTAGAHATIMTDANAHFVANELVGFTINDVTTGASAVITANTVNTVTVAAIAGGWTLNDVYSISRAAPAAPADRTITLRDSFTTDVSDGAAAAAQLIDKLTFTAVITGCASLRDELKDIELLGDLLCFADTADPNCIISLGYEFIKE